MKRPRTDEECRYVESLLCIFGLLGKRWTGPIIGALMQGEAHFAELHRTISGISERILSERLTELGHLGLVTREVIDGPPQGVVYRLTEKGEGLRPAMLELKLWADSQMTGHLTRSYANRPSA